MAGSSVEDATFAHQLRVSILNCLPCCLFVCLFAVIQYNIPKSADQCREKLREEFLKHKDLKDIRTIDLMVVKGRQELQETANKWKNSHNIMRYWRDTTNPQPKDFLSKFLSGHNN